MLRQSPDQTMRWSLRQTQEREMNSELKIEELDVVSGGGQALGQAFWNGLADGFEKAGGEISCRFQGSNGTDKCDFTSGNNTVTVIN